MRARLLLTLLALLVLPFWAGILPHDERSLAVHAQSISGQILAPAGRQVAALNLQAPRPKLFTKFDPPAYVTEVSAGSPNPLVAAVVVCPFSEGAAFGGDVVGVDLASGSLADLIVRTDASESFGGVTWWPDGTTLLFHRQDLASPGVSYAGMADVVYPSRIEVMRAGVGPSILVEDGRQPVPAPDGLGFVFLRTSSEGTALLALMPIDAAEQVLIPATQFRDIASPRFRPQGDRIAFMAPGMFVGATPLDGIFGLISAKPAYAHGIPWDLLGHECRWNRQTPARGIGRRRWNAVLVTRRRSDLRIRWYGRVPGGRDIRGHQSHRICRRLRELFVVARAVTARWSHAGRRSTLAGATRLTCYRRGRHAR